MSATLHLSADDSLSEQPGHSVGQVASESAKAFISVATCDHFKKNDICVAPALPGEAQCWNHLSSNAREAFKDELRERLGSGAGLSGADLSGVELSGVELRSADLRNADLSGADLGRADLGAADLSEADLSAAVLRKANLAGACLRGCDLTGTSLRSATLDGTDLRDVRGGDEAEFNGAFVGVDVQAAPFLVERMRSQAQQLDLKPVLMAWIMGFGVLFALVNIVAAFVGVALPLGVAGIIAFVVVGWELAGVFGMLIGGAVGAVLGLVPSVLVAVMNRGRRSHHASLPGRVLPLRLPPLVGCVHRID